MILSCVMKTACYINIVFATFLHNVFAQRDHSNLIFYTSWISKDNENRYHLDHALDSTNDCTTFDFSVFLVYFLHFKADILVSTSENGCLRSIFAIYNTNEDPAKEWETVIKGIRPNKSPDIRMNCEKDALG